MAVVFMEGFDNVTAAGVTAKGWSGGLTSVSGGRLGGQCGNKGVNSGNTSVNLPTSYSTLFVGFAFLTTSVSGINNPFFAIRAGTTTTKTCQITVSGGALAIANSGGTVVATGSTPLSNSTWYFIEVKLVINGASGTVEAHLGGQTEIAQTTVNFGSTNVGSLQLQATNTGGGTNSYDDIWALDTTGSVSNSFLGDTRIQTIKPTGAGNYTQWTPSTGSNWQNVDDTTPNDDTDYNTDTVVGDIDTFATSDIDSGATVYGVQTDLYARKDDVGTRQIAPLIRQSSTDYVGNTVTLSTTYSFYKQIYTQDPSGSNWTAANVNADEFGYKLIA